MSKIETSTDSQTNDKSTIKHNTKQWEWNVPGTYSRPANPKIGRGRFFGQMG